MKRTIELNTQHKICTQISLYRISYIVLTTKMKVNSSRVTPHRGLPPLPLKNRTLLGSHDRVNQRQRQLEPEVPRISAQDFLNRFDSVEHNCFLRPTNKHEDDTIMSGFPSIVSRNLLPAFDSEREIGTLSIREPNLNSLLVDGIGLLEPEESSEQYTLNLNEFNRSLGKKSNASSTPPSSGSALPSHIPTVYDTEQACVIFEADEYCRKAVELHRSKLAARSLSQTMTEFGNTTTRPNMNQLMPLIKRFLTNSYAENGNVSAILRQYRYAARNPQSGHRIPCPFEKISQTVKVLQRLGNIVAKMKNNPTAFNLDEAIPNLVRTTVDEMNQELHTLELVLESIEKDLEHTQEGLKINKGAESMR